MTRSGHILQVFFRVCYSRKTCWATFLPHQKPH